jgi:MYXO-CTERM domain-containing protein
MRLTSALVASSFTAFAVVALTSHDAHAGLASCGNIHVEAEASCEARVGATCKADCEPLSFTAACSGELYAACQGDCMGELQAQCQGDCEASCQGQCEVKPGDLDCEGQCSGDCTGQCGAQCSADASAECEGQDNTAECEADFKARCRASCSATCDGECSASCEGTPIDADCEGKCSASCEGECSADANLECQIQCQADGYVDCEGQLRGQCKADCDTDDGAIFCNNKYVDHGNNFAECVDALNAVLAAHVKLHAEGSSGCSGSGCEVQGKAEAKTTCSVSSVGAEPRSGGLWLLSLFGLALGFGSRRRR